MCCPFDVKNSTKWFSFNPYTHETEKNLIENSVELERTVVIIAISSYTASTTSCYAKWKKICNGMEWKAFSIAILFFLFSEFQAH